MKKFALIFFLLLSCGNVYAQAEAVLDTAADIVFTPAGDIASTDVQAAIEELDSEKLSSESQTLQDVTTLGNTTTLGITAGTLNVTGLTASELISTDGSKNLQSLSVSTYPSLTELSYVKGVTSSIQTQIDSIPIDDFNDTEGYIPVLNNGLFEDSPIYADALISGNIGIGTTAPQSNLEVDGDIYTDSITFDQDAGVVIGEATMAWDDLDGTVSIGMVGGTVKLQVGQENLIRAKNISGSDIADGTVVRIVGASGQRPTVDLADKDTCDEHCEIAVATETIGSNNNGYVTTFGIVRDIDTSSFSEGQDVFLGDDGALVGIAPDAPALAVHIGTVIVSNANNGAIFVNTHFDIWHKPDGYIYTDHIIGIGSNRANYQLDVTGDIYTDSSLYVDDYIYGNTSTGLLSFVGSFEAREADMVINYNGNLGLGTTSPSTKLDIEGTSTVELSLNGAAAGVGGCDSNTALLLHLDGADAATSTSDENCNAGGAKTITFNNQAQLDTAQFKFGTSSLLLDGTGDFIGISDSTDFDFGTNDFTVDMWVRFNNASGRQELFSNYSGSDVNGTLILEKYNSPSEGLDIVYYSGGYTRIHGAYTFSTGTWYHIAFVRTSGNAMIFVDGTQVGVTTALSASLTHTGTPVHTIGALTGGANGVNGWIDEARVSNTARWTSNFTPETAPFDTESQLMSPKISLQSSGVDLWTIKNDGADSDKFEILEDDTDVRFAIAAGGNVGIGSTNPAGLLDITGGDLLVGVAGDVLFVDQSTGNVGIGTTSPGNALEVSGSAQVLAYLNSSNTASYLRFGNSSATAGYIGYNAGNLEFQTAATTRMTVDSSGNVGIGIPAPTADFHVERTIGGTGGALVKIDTTEDGLDDRYYVLMREDTDGAPTTGFAFTTSGKLGIGTTAPDSPLEISSTPSGTNPLLKLTRSASGQEWGFSPDNNYFNIFDYTNDAVNARFTIDTSGNVGIGETSPRAKTHISTGTSGAITPSTSADELVLEGAGAVGLTIFSPDSTGSANLFFGHNNDADAGRIVYSNSTDNLSIFNSGSETLTLTGLGSVGIGTASPNSKLSINGVTESGTGSAGYGYVFTGDTDTGLYYVGANNFNLLAGGTTVVSISNGSIAGSNAATYLKTGSASAPTYSFNSDTNTGIFSGGADILGFTTGASEKMRIDSSGNVGIGTTAPTKLLSVADSCVQLKSPDGSLSNCCVDNLDVFTCTGI